MVDGKRRDGGQTVPYRLTSEFLVRPWSGITADDAQLESDNTVSFRIGPRNVLPVSGAGMHGPSGPALNIELGPIDYPDSYQSPVRFIRNQRSFQRDPQDPGDPEKVELYCFTCTFRPWIDVGDADSAVVMIDRANGPGVFTGAVRDGDRWRTQAALEPGDSASVLPGGVLDSWGNYNGSPSATVVRGGGDPTPTPTPTETPTPDPTETATPDPTETADAGSDRDGDSGSDRDGDAGSDRDGDAGSDRDGDARSD